MSILHLNADGRAVSVINFLVAYVYKMTLEVEMEKEAKEMIDSMGTGYVMSDDVGPKLFDALGIAGPHNHCITEFHIHLKAGEPVTITETRLATAADGRVYDSLPRVFSEYRLVHK